MWVAHEEEASDHYVIRRYSASGMEVGKYVPRSTLAPLHHSHPGEDSFLVAWRDRVGWYSNITREYMEFSLDGRLLTRAARLALEAPQRVDGVGLCDDGSVFVSVYPVSREERKSAIFTLDRASTAWKPATLAGDTPSSPYRPVYGCDGSNVVVRTRMGGESLGLSWFRAEP